MCHLVAGADHLGGTVALQLSSFFSDTVLEMVKIQSGISLYTKGNRAEDNGTRELSLILTDALLCGKKPSSFSASIFFLTAGSGNSTWWILSMP